MRKVLENPWKVVEKKYCVILHKHMNGVHVKEPKEFRRFEDAKSYYKRMEEKKVFWYLGFTGQLSYIGGCYEL